MALTPAPKTEYKDTALKTAVVELIAISPAEQARPLPEDFNTADGEPRIAREATVKKADGSGVKVDVIGTAAQWAFFNGVSVEARFAKSERNPEKPAAWYFSPVAAKPRIEDENAF